MDYTVGELARLSGLSTRALRLYDQIGLLRPERNAENGYRHYGAQQLERLQHIMLYREMGMGLKETAALIASPDFDPKAALESHRGRLLEQKRRIETLLATVQNTLEALNGGKTMDDVEKFEGFKRKVISENEEKYGSEIRAAYGDRVVDASNEKATGMSQTNWNRREELGQEIDAALRAAMAGGDPASQAADSLCEMHKEWLCLSWPDGMYTPELHRDLAESYVADGRFKAYYDGAAGEGAAAFLAQAVAAFVKK